MKIMKKYAEMTDIEMLDKSGFGIFTSKDVKNPDLFVQEDTELVDDGYSYTLTPFGELTGCLVIGHVERNGKRYSITERY